MTSTISLVIGLIIAITLGALLNELIAFIGSRSPIISGITSSILKLIHKVKSF